MSPAAIVGTRARGFARIAFSALLLQGAGMMSSASAGQPAEVIWSYQADRLSGTPDRLVVTGTKTDGTFRPTGVALPEPQEAEPPVKPFPLNANLLPLFDIRPFGAEERASATAQDDGIALSCAAGQRPAGLVFKAQGYRYPGAMRGVLAVEGSSQAGLSFAVVQEGQDAPRTLPARPDGDTLASVPSTDWAPAGGAARQLVMLCPNSASTATITAIRLVPAGRPPAGIGTWLWDARAWLDRPDLLVSALRRDDVRDLFLQIRVDGEAIADRTKLIHLITAMSNAGIAVHSVEGDPDMASAAGRTEALRRARILRGLREAGMVRSFQYDIEPYLRPGFASDPVAGWQEWATTINALSDALGEKVSVVVPFWMLGRPGGERALEAAAGSIAGITVMAYRTDSAQVEQAAQDWLDWGAFHDLLISIAIENGPLPAEYNRIYRRAEYGDLILDRSGQQPMVRMLGSAVSNSYTKPTYSFSQELEIDPARISFLNDRGALAQARERLGRVLSGWMAFERLMIHGLITPGG
ncbi:hypothetical protein [Mesorhizobium sp. SP-1A]|uniref:hypothetical protein n=1 Tax=Mesorhizobium sp. SP-1A TaxID=3077840 RepID=UPI0028F7485E|nr:hypothetical protein [Mesorhizobium sp. SP-1A]